MSFEAVRFYARKFFPHLLEKYSVLIVLEVLSREKKT